MLGKWVCRHLFMDILWQNMDVIVWNIYFPRRYVLFYIQHTSSCTISCLQNTLIYIIIVCKQTSAYYKSSDLPYTKKTRVFLINLFYKNI
jgi:hypothetical protein